MFKLLRAMLEKLKIPLWLWRIIINLEEFSVIFIEVNVIEAVCAGLSQFGCFKIHGYFVDSVPRSGKSTELLDLY